MTLQEHEGPIDAQIVWLLVSALPSSWRSAQLEIEFEPQPDGSEGFVHRIRSPEGHREIVSPPDELYTITFNLYDLFLGAGRPWKRVKYLVTAKEGTDWDYRVTFEY